LAYFALVEDFCANRKGGTGGGWWVCPKGANSMAASWLGYRKPWLVLGGPFLCLLCINWLRKQSSIVMGPPFLTMTYFSWSARAVIGQEPWQMRTH